ncbi:trehalose operon repressor TreR [Vibrio sp. ZSDZ65]|uniref:Trehalose operon repressor TreR n=1 Tax=Vibrio qingdaonensis TaxID=2829491 RepID=A0A9X3HVI6_9VIBR|nr:trehalose operon repressor TreR [Vibrio qingdaonensis]MCW8345351.1 trehalose operon repressor TreR [Vibrio qingdaonensis]
MSKKLTILDIAKLSGVGKSTVSRVLTKDPKVKPDTRQKVEAIIAEHGYVPSKSAQSMRSGGNPKVIGVIISRLDSPSENKAVSGMLSVLYAAGYDVVIMESQFDPEKTNEHLTVLRKRNVDGVIVFGFTSLDVDEVSRWQSKAVVIAMDTDKVSSINYDNQGLIRSVLSKLATDGLTNLAFIGVDPTDKTTGLARLTAYQEWCEEQGVALCYQTGALHHDSAYHLVDKVISTQLQALVCASDTLALGAVKRLQELGREDVVVTGIGGNELLSFLFPKVYSIDPGYQQAGSKAAHLLISQLEQGESIQHLTQEAV